MAKKEKTKKTLPKSKKFYVTINGKKMFLDQEMVKKYQLEAGSFLPFTNLEVFAE
jgi:hypothetical protein